MKVGIDMTYIPRFRDKSRLAKKVLSDEEFLAYSDSIDKAQYLASRYALKEALIKALELSILSVDLRLIKTIKKDNGAVYIEFNGKKYECSLTHENKYCVGIVLND
jgi:phosphopantethiene--protein transferase domain